MAEYYLATNYHIVPRSFLILEGIGLLSIISNSIIVSLQTVTIDNPNEAMRRSLVS